MAVAATAPPRAARKPRRERSWRTVSMIDGAHIGASFLRRVRASAQGSNPALQPLTTEPPKAVGGVAVHGLRLELVERHALVSAGQPLDPAAVMVPHGHAL